MTDDADTLSPHVKRQLADAPEKLVTGDAARRRFSLSSDEIRINPELSARPPWMRVKVPNHGPLKEMEARVSEGGLHTVCESAACPNRGECWSIGTATLMILGNICTRSCGFCAVKTGRPTELDLDEPRRVGEQVAWMKLRYVVITSVDRDELADCGAAVWADTIREIRKRSPETGIETLIPDMKGIAEHQQTIFDARPHVLSHNLETVIRLHHSVRPQATYQRSLEVLTRARASGLIAKSGMMLGLGESNEEVVEALEDLFAAGCQVLTLGQYLQPTVRHLPIERWVHPDEFAELKRVAEAIGFSKVDSGPLVRSSYHAEGVIADDSPLKDIIAAAVGGARASFS